jgi:S1-C subfamily serine protease
MITERHSRLIRFLVTVLSAILFSRFAGAAGPAAVPTQPASPPITPRGELSASEKNTIDIFKRISPSVVSVANKAILRDLFSMRLYEVPQGAGSGFMWDKKGHIISNFHVVYQASALQVTLKDGASYDAEVVGVDPDHDIAVLKIKAPDESLTPIPVGSSADLQVGQNVMAIGNPFGLDTSLSVGIVSALGRTMNAMTGRQIFDVIQTDAAINPGNSGGPLLDSAGRLIGMNAAIMSTSGSYAGVGFAVPVDTIRRIVPQLIADGKVKRAGIGIQIVPEPILRQAGLEGADVLRTIPKSAAAKAGLQGVKETRGGDLMFGDIIVGVDGTPIRTNDDFLAIMDRHQAGDKIKITYTRNKEKRTAEITIQDLE